MKFHGRARVSTAPRERRARRYVGRAAIHVEADRRHDRREQRKSLDLRLSAGRGRVTEQVGGDDPHDGGLQVSVGTRVPVGAFDRSSPHLLALEDRHDGHDKAEGMTLIDGGRTIAVSNDDDFGVTDDGNGHLLQKLLPSGAVDHNEVWFFRLSRSLYDKH